MSEQRTEEFTAPRVSVNLAVSGDVPGAEKRPDAAPDENRRRENAQRGADSTGKQAEAMPPAKSGPAEKGKEPKVRKVSPAKVKLQSRLPALEDDAEIGVEKEQIVTRDGKADLLFMGALLASAAPDLRAQGQVAGIPDLSDQRRQARVLEGRTEACSRRTRTPTRPTCSIPHPSSMPSQLMRSAREIARAKPVTWMDAAVAFFGYDPLAKVLYRKLDVRFEEQIS